MVCMSSVVNWNLQCADTKSFVWTKPADGIRTSVERFWLRIADSRQ